MIVSLYSRRVKDNKGWTHPSKVLFWECLSYPCEWRITSRTSSQMPHLLISSPCGSGMTIWVLEGHKHLNHRIYCVFFPSVVRRLAFSSVCLYSTLYTDACLNCLIHGCMFHLSIYTSLLLHFLFLFILSCIFHDLLFYNLHSQSKLLHFYKNICLSFFNARSRTV